MKLNVVFKNVYGKTIAFESVVDNVFDVSQIKTGFYLLEFFNGIELVSVNKISIIK